MQIYLEQIQRVRFELKGCPAFFDRLMTVDIQDSHKILRKVVYKNRFKSLQDSEHILSLVAKKICEVQNDILGKKSKSLSKVDYRLRISLLQQAGHEERIFLENFFCTSTSQLLLDTKKNEVAHRKKINAVKIFEEKDILKIKELLKELSIYRRNLQKLEFEYRSELFRGLRIQYKN